MADLGSGGSSPALNPISPPVQVVDLTEDKDSKALLGTPSLANGEVIAALEEISSDEDEVESFADSETFINDLLQGAWEDEGDEYYPGDMCTPEEALDYRRQLHRDGAEKFVNETIVAGTITAKKLLTAFGILPPPCFEGSPDSRYLRMLGLAIMEELMRRKKLPEYNNINDVVTLLQQSKKILVITGAGISTNLGIPDFRSKHTGFYEKMREKGFSSGEEVFDIEMFNEDPTQFYENCSDTFPREGLTTPTHAFIALLQSKGKLLTNYTQNIDNIEESAGIDKDKLIQCHGSWATATCRKCGFKVPGSLIMKEVQEQRVPKCSRCIENLKDVSNVKKRKRTVRKNWDDDSDSDDDDDYDIPEPGVMKPDITFFGEALPHTFFDRFNDHDKSIADLVLVIGTSMKVAPVSEIPMALPRNVPHIYISREPCRHIGFDVTLLGDCDVIVGELVKRAQWVLKHPMLPEERETILNLVEEEKAIWRVSSKVLKGVMH